MDLVYLAKPIYGGWVTFTAHLSLKYGCNVYKITKRGESKKRDYGYNVSYQNLRIDQLLEKGNIMITACDKHYWKYLHLFPKNTPLVIHDPTELKGKENPLPKLLHHFKIITIRDSVYTFLKNTYNIESELKLHPFYEYEKKNNLCHSFNSLSISIIGKFFATLAPALCIINCGSTAKQSSQVVSIEPLELLKASDISLLLIGVLCHLTLLLCGSISPSE